MFSFLEVLLTLPLEVIFLAFFSLALRILGVVGMILVCLFSQICSLKNSQNNFCDMFLFLNLEVVCFVLCFLTSVLAVCVNVEAEMKKAKI